MNAYESGEQRVIPAVLVYLFCGGEVLMLHRNADPQDFHKGKYNGLGGKLEPTESPRAAALRELYEEAGVALPAERLQARGVIHFPDFKAHKKQDWTVFLFAAELQTKPALGACAEGTLEWVGREKVLDLPLWPGDRFFLEEILTGKSVLGTIWYDQSGKVLRHQIET